MCLNFFLLIDHNNNPFSTHNSSNLHFNYPNPNTYQFQNQFSNTPQSMQNYGFAPNVFMPSPVPNYPPYYWSIMSNLSQKPFFPWVLKLLQILEQQFFFVFSTQIGFDGVSVVNEATQNENVEDQAHARRKSPKWTIDWNLVLLSELIKHGTNIVIGRNQKNEAFSSKIDKYCNEHCSFDPPIDVASCLNHYNYMNK